MLVFPVLFLLSCSIGLLCVRFLGPLGLMDVPGGRKAHGRPVPRTGGIAFTLALFIACTFLGRYVPLSGFEWAALSLIAFLGFIDDLLDLPARWKILATFILAVALASHSLASLSESVEWIRLLWFSIPYHPVPAYLLFLMLYWGTPQAFNLIDGANGLAIGYSIIVSTVLFGMNAIGPSIPIVLTALLVLNWPVPRLFLGDCGSLSLGLLFAMLAHRAFAQTQPNAILWLFAYPIVDMTMVVLIRTLQGQSIFRGDRSHLHHQLADRLGRRAFLAVPILWLLSGACAIAPLITGSWRVIPWLSLTLLGGLALAFLATSVKNRTPNFDTQV